MRVGTSVLNKCVTVITLLLAMLATHLFYWHQDRDSLLPEANTILRASWFQLILLHKRYLVKHLVHKFDNTPGVNSFSEPALILWTDHTSFWLIVSAYVYTSYNVVTVIGSCWR